MQTSNVSSFPHVNNVNTVVYYNCITNIILMKIYKLFFIYKSPNVFLIVELN